MLGRRCCHDNGVDTGWLLPGDGVPASSNRGLLTSYAIGLQLCALGVIEFCKSSRPDFGKPAVLFLRCSFIQFANVQNLNECFIQQASVLYVEKEKTDNFGLL